MVRVLRLLDFVSPDFAFNSGAVCVLRVWPAAATPHRDAVLRTVADANKGVLQMEDGPFTDGTDRL